MIVTDQRGEVSVIDQTVLCSDPQLAERSAGYGNIQCPGETGTKANTIGGAAMVIKDHAQLPPQRMTPGTDRIRVDAHPRASILREIDEAEIVDDLDLGPTPLADLTAHDRDQTFLPFSRVPHDRLKERRAEIRSAIPHAETCGSENRDPAVPQPSAVLPWITPSTVV
jgi:hypothetical protein